MKLTAASTFYDFNAESDAIERMQVLIWADQPHEAQTVPIDEMLIYQQSMQMKSTTIRLKTLFF